MTMRTERIFIPFNDNGEGFDLRIHYFGSHQISINESTSGRFWWMAASYAGDCPPDMVEGYAESLKDWRLLGGGNARSRNQARKRAIAEIRAWVRDRKEGRACG
jgi:hypothetical protein